MHKVLLVIGFFVFFLVISPVSAEVLDRSSAPEDIANIRTLNATSGGQIEGSGSAQFRQKAFEEKLITIKDERKRVTVSNINTRLAAINTKQASVAQQAIERFEMYMGIIASRSAALKANGTDTATLDVGITNATLAINNAKAAISMQSSTDYTLSIDTENTLRQTVEAMVKKLRQDLQATQNAVTVAKQMVIKVASELHTYGAK